MGATGATAWDLSPLAGLTGLRRLGLFDMGRSDQLVLAGLPDLTIYGG